MKHIGLALVLLFQAHATSVLVGTWRLDVAHSVLTGGLDDYRATLEQRLRIEVRGNDVTVVTTTSGIGSSFAPKTTTEQYRLDGITRTEPWGDVFGQKRRRKADWETDGRRFEIVDEYDFGRVVQRWEVSDDPNTLSIDYVSTTGPGLRRYLVYKRQPS